jgi:hypothetical protein
VNPGVEPADVAHGVAHLAEIDVALAVEAFEILGVEFADALFAQRLV